MAPSVINRADFNHPIVLPGCSGGIKPWRSRQSVSSQKLTASGGTLDRRLETDREADFSTEQARSQAPSWLSRPHGNQGWPQGHRSTPRPRPEAPVGVIGQAPQSGAMNALSDQGAKGGKRLKAEAEKKSSVWLTRRPEFLAVAKGRRHHAALFTIQMASRQDATGLPRFGLTVTAKTGNSVVRNRIKRRLREAIRSKARLVAFPGTDYVLIGRRALLDAPFETIISELVDGILRLKPRSSSSPKPLPSSN